MEIWNQLACVKIKLVHKKEKKKQGGLISGAAFGRLISPKQIISPFCYFFQGELFRCKHCCAHLPQAKLCFCSSYLQVLWPSPVWQMSPCFIVLGENNAVMVVCVRSCCFCESSFVEVFLFLFFSQRSFQNDIDVLNETGTTADHMGSRSRLKVKLLAAFKALCCKLMHVIVFVLLTFQFQNPYITQRGVIFSQ